MISKTKQEIRYKLVIATIISLIPLNILRIFLYRLLLKYDICLTAKIGILTIIAVEKVTIKNSRIGKINRFVGPFSLKIDEGANIESRNEFLCGDWVLEDRFNNSNYLRNCKIGKNTLITTLHYIDTVGGFELQDNSWIAGRNSQFWTHGAGEVDRAIIIGQGCYVGSAVRFAPGAVIANNNIISLGSVVTKKFYAENTLIGGVPAQVLRENYNWQEKDPDRIKDTADCK